MKLDYNELDKYYRNRDIVIRCHNEEQVQMLVHYFSSKFGSKFAPVNSMLRQYNGECLCFRADGKSWCNESWYAGCSSFIIKDFDEFIIDLNPPDMDILFQ